MVEPRGPGPWAVRAASPLLVGLVVLVVLFSGAHGSTSTRLTPSADPTPGLHVAGAQLTRDGHAFLPRGFSLVGLLTPDWCASTTGRAAAAHFGQEELDAAKGWNANTLRFQVSQRGLADTTVAQASRDAYLQRVVDGVRLARSNGFAVVVSMQDQSIGCGPAHPLPSSQTVAAWRVLAPALMDDPQVMFELFNEPDVPNTSDGWLQWRGGGSGPSTNLGDDPVGHQTLVGLIRSLGSQNVLIADGPNKAERLSGLLPLDDPAGQLMYGIHPYFLSTGQSWWDQQYGFLTDTTPVIATEWNFLASGCTASTAALARELLPYLHVHGIGLLAHAFDVSGHTVTGDWTWTPTECGTASPGSGRLVQDYFATQHDGPTPLGAVVALRGLAPSPTRVDLTWDAATGEVDSYEVLRDGVVIASTSGPGFTDTTAVAGTSYEYAVRAADATGGTGPLSEVVPVRTPAEPDVTAPSIPTGLAATASGFDEVDLAWGAATDANGVAGYQVSRDGVVVGSTTTQEFHDTGLREQTRYRSTVVALDAAGNASPESDAADVATPAAPDTEAPTAPTTLRASTPTGNQVTVTWAASSDNVAVDHYSLERDGVVVASPPGTTHLDTGLVPGTTYDYVVRAVDTSGNTGPPSATIHVLNPLPRDTTAPTRPTSLTGSLQSPTRSSLSWLASTDNVGVTGYRITRDGRTIATVATRTYVDNAMPSNATHVYTVRALDAAGNLSSASSSASVIAPKAAANGLTGKYFDTASFSTLRLTRVDSSVNFSWGTAAPTAGMGPDTFSVRWTGRIIPVSNQTYTFYTQSDDAIRLWVNGTQLVNSWTNHTSREDKRTITLKASQSYTIQVDYRDNTGTALVRLSWSTPSMAKAVVPTSQLLAR
jgi:chitodextrinase